MSKQPNVTSPQRQQQNHRSDALNSNRGTSGTNRKRPATTVW